MDLLTQASVAIDGSKFKAANTRDKNFTREGGATPRPIGEERGALSCAARHGRPAGAVGRAGGENGAFEREAGQAGKRDAAASSERSNETHVSTTDADARLYRKGPGKEAKLCFIGHGLMENRHGLLVDACLTPADGHAERVAALHLIEPYADRPTVITLGADKAYD